MEDYCAACGVWHLLDLFTKWCDDCTIAYYARRAAFHAGRPASYGRAS